jgi:Flp pilus assembly protein TadG
MGRPKFRRLAEAPPVTRHPSGRGNRHQPRRGVATIEFALVAPILVLLLLGIWEIGRLVQVMEVLYNAAREGARQASTATATLTDIKANVRSYIQNAEPSISNLTGYDMTYANITRPSVTDPTGATQLDKFTITVTLPFRNVSWLATTYFIPANATLTAKVEWYSMRDLPVTITTGLPVE